MSSRIYLDNAATSWPKPESVYRAVDEFQRNLGCGGTWHLLRGPAVGPAGGPCPVGSGGMAAHAA